MRQILIAAATLVVANLAADARAVVANSKMTVTFEGLARGRQVRLIGEYDGFNWDAGISAAGHAAFKTDPGFQAVIHNRVAGVIQAFGGSGSITPANGLVSVRSGHFAAFNSSPFGVTFNAYRNGVQVGTLTVPNLTTADTLVQFDKTFSKIDRFEIIGQVAFDNLVFKFNL